VDAAWLFGAAARGTAGRASDLDLAISAPHAGSVEWAMVEEVVEAAPTLRWEELRAGDPVRASILRDRVLLYERELGLADRAEDFDAAHVLLERALARLAEALHRLASEPGDDIVRDAVVQRFEFTVEQFSKTLRLALHQRGVQSGLGPRAALQGTAAEGWLNDEARPWRDMIEDRNRTSHTYRKEIGDAVLAHVPDHLARMAALAARLPGLLAPDHRLPRARLAA